MPDYTQHVRSTPVPQTRHRPAAPTPPTRPLPKSTQVANNGGGFAWAITDWQRLERFLILGTEGGTYYTAEKALTVDNAQAVKRCIVEDGPRVVRMAVEVSVAGRATKNDEALFVIALCMTGDAATKNAAIKAIPLVARTGTHLLHLVKFAEGFRGWGRGLRTAVAQWYQKKTVSQLCYQLVKYQSRDGWSQRDVLRLAHPKPDSPGRKGAYLWATKGWDDIGHAEPEDGTLTIWVYEKMKRSKTEDEVIRLIRQHNLTHEFVPSQWLGSAAVWQELLPNLPLTALVRNLGRLTSNGVLKPLSKAEDLILRTLGDQAYISKSRLHPLNILVAAKTYEQGHGSLGSLTWEPNVKILKALDGAFRLAFGNVPSTGKRVMLGLDVSGSMTSAMVGSPRQKGKGLPLTSREASAALALITANVEPKHLITGFTASGTAVVRSAEYNQSGISQLSIHPHDRLTDVCNYTARLGFSSTDLSLPMLYALEKGLDFDTFVIYTDNEVNHGAIHPSKALQLYRERTGIPAKLIVVAMSSDGFSIADPNDAGMLDVVGFDLATPQVISAFMGGASTTVEEEE